ncbi:MAG: thioredoxin domain-containing protein [Acidobacteria bacterium]|nr:thioredoxin domain-containing protein [Acidobacteriota bacterium]
MRVLFAALLLTALATAQNPPKAGAQSEAAPAKSNKAPAPQPDWQKATELPALDMTGLTPAQKSTLLKLLREESCICGCSMKLAECRIKDPACRDSRTLASIAAQEFRAGKNDATVRAILKNSDMAKARRAALLGEPVRIDTQGAPSRGPANARLTIVEYSDFQCPYCRVAAQHVYTILAKYPKDIRLVFKQFPLESHSMAAFAAEAALAAHAQGKFWELHDKMFANPRAINRNTVVAWAGEVGIDVSRFTADLNTGKFRKQVDKEADEGTAVGVTGTPSFFFNGKLYRGAMEPEAVLPVVEEELKKAR